jgi:hypothetical protein
MRCAEYPLIPISYTNAGNNNYSYIRKPKGQSKMDIPEKLAT